MTFQQLASIDLNALNKTQLKSYVKLAREEWGRAIDLRTANVNDLAEYLVMYLQFKSELEIACDEIENNFETVEIEELMETPSNFNEITRATLDILLTHGTQYENELTTSWFSEILCDCRMRSLNVEKVNEKLILKDYIYYGLAGIQFDEIDLFKRHVSTPEEFFNLNVSEKQTVDQYQKLNKAFGKNIMSEMVVYHSIRDNLNYLQKLLSISSLRPKNYAIKDKLFATLDYDSQMVLTAYDRDLLKKESIRVVKYFNSIINDYKLYQELDNGSLQDINPKVDLLLIIASFADHCWIYSQRKQLPPDRITLYYQNWDKSLNNYSTFCRVVAVR